LWNDLYTHTVPPTRTVTGAYYCSVLKTVINHISRKQLELVGHWMLNQDNARPHVVNTVIQFLVSKGIQGEAGSEQTSCTEDRYGDSISRS
jgi:hypothetical protein